jgi:ferredoxin-NADP reductase
VLKTASTSRSQSKAGAGSTPRDAVALDAEALRALVPDLGLREAFLCGPDPLARRLSAELERAGMTPGQIHFESFTF